MILRNSDAASRRAVPHACERAASSGVSHSRRGRPRWSRASSPVPALSPCERAKEAIALSKSTRGRGWEGAAARLDASAQPTSRESYYAGIEHPDRSPLRHRRPSQLRRQCWPGGAAGFAEQRPANIARRGGGGGALGGGLSRIWRAPRPAARMVRAADGDPDEKPALAHYPPHPGRCARGSGRRRRAHRLGRHQRSGEDDSARLEVRMPTAAGWRRRRSRKLWSISATLIPRGPTAATLEAHRGDQSPGRLAARRPLDPAVFSPDLTRASRMPTCLAPARRRDSRLTAGEILRKAHADPMRRPRN